MATQSSQSLPTQASFSQLSFVAGLISGAAGQAVGHPLDTLKVHAQAASTENLRFTSLWRGAAVPIATTGAIQSFALGIFENTRRALWPNEAPTPLPVLAASGSICGLSASLITCPLSRVKVLQQLTGASFVQAAHTAVAHGSLYRAFPTAALWESTRGSYMVIYSLLKQALQPPPAATPPSGMRAGDRPLPLWARILAGGGANVLNFAVLYPLNTVWLVQMAELPPALVQPPPQPPQPQPPQPQQSPPRPLAGRGLLATARAMHHEGGIRRFYRGYGWTLLRAGPVAAVIMPCFELLLPILERMHARLF